MGGGDIFAHRKPMHTKNVCVCVFDKFEVQGFQRWFVISGQQPYMQIGIEDDVIPRWGGGGG